MIFVAKKKNAPKRFITFVTGNGYYYDYHGATMSGLTKSRIKQLKKKLRKQWPELTNVPDEEIKVSGVVNEFHM
jgi:hypothetical protein